MHMDDRLPSVNSHQAFPSSRVITKPLLQVFGCVRMDDFLASLAERIPPNRTALDIFRRLHVPMAEVTSDPDAPLQTKVTVSCAARRKSYSLFTPKPLGC